MINQQNSKNLQSKMINDLIKQHLPIGNQQLLGDEMPAVLTDHGHKPPIEIPVKQPKELPSPPQEITHYHSSDDQFNTQG